MNIKMNITEQYILHEEITCKYCHTLISTVPIFKNKYGYRYEIPMKKCPLCGRNLGLCRKNTYKSARRINRKKTSKFDIYSIGGICCALCKSEINLERHHIIPLGLNGADDVSNLVTICHHCHTEIHKTRENEIKYSDISLYKNKPIKAGIIKKYIIPYTQELHTRLRKFYTYNKYFIYYGYVPKFKNICYFLPVNKYDNQYIYSDTIDNISNEYIALEIKKYTNCDIQFSFLSPEAYFIEFTSDWFHL